MNKQHILASLINTNTLRVGSTVKCQFHKSASAELRNHTDRQERSPNGQFASIAGEVTSIKDVSTGTQVMIRRTDGHDRPFGSLTTNQVIRSLSVDGTEVML
jgi:hypothetical protein